MDIDYATRRPTSADVSPLVYIILVNWNAGGHTLACLESLRNLSYPSYKVLVVDNASSDGSPDAIAAAHPDLALVRLPRNLGFTGANNVGFHHALAQEAQFVYLLNTDTRVAPDFLSAAVTTATSSPDIGVVGSKVLQAARPTHLQFAGGRVNLHTGYNGRPMGYGKQDHGQCDHVTDVAWVTGCAMLISRACVEATAGLDDAFFAFHEDIDLCLRARAQGFRVVMSPQSRVWHEGGGSLGGGASALHMYYDVRNGLRLVHKHNPITARLGRLARTCCIIGAHVLQVLLMGPTNAALRAIADGVKDYYRGVTHARPSS